MQKRSQNLTLDKIKQTFQTTEWDEGKKKTAGELFKRSGSEKQEEAVAAWVEAVEEADEDYDPNQEAEAEEEEDQSEYIEQWDEENERLIRRKVEKP
jgi:hypothetical protein